MPTSQPTPGPSTLSGTALLQQINAKKRPVSELPVDEEPRQSKKCRRDLDLVEVDKNGQGSAKENKKKRKKKKRKSPLTAPDADHDKNTQIKILSGAVALSSSSIPTVVQALQRPEVVKVSSVAAEPTQVLGLTDDEKPMLSSSEKGKGKVTSPDESQKPIEKAVSVPSISPDTMNDSQSQIDELKAQLRTQNALLSRYRDNLSNIQQSLTCEICLDLLYKPFALSPCGHIACYMCLIRWFTSVQHNDNGNPNPNPESLETSEDVARVLSSQTAMRGTYIRKRKTCPSCRAAVVERPAEVWSIKSMVTNLIKNKLVDFTSIPPPPSVDPPNEGANGRANQDVWRNIFRKSGHGGGFHFDHPMMFPPPPENNVEGQGPEEMGMYDAEDGGIYRCLECMHEIWGGVCTNCNRQYAGHARFGDDDSDSDDGSDRPGENFLGRRLRQIMEGVHDPHWNGGLEQDSEDEEGFSDMDDPMFMFRHAPHIGGFHLSSDSEDMESVLEISEDSYDSGDDGGMWMSGSEDENDHGPQRRRRMGPGLGEQIIEEIHFDDDGVPMRHRHGRIQEVNSDEEEVEEHHHSEEEDDYEGSFIDDDDDEGDIPPRNWPDLQQRQNPRRVVIGVDSEEEGEESDVDVGEGEYPNAYHILDRFLGQRYRVGELRGHIHQVLTDLSDEEEEEEEEEVVQRPRRGGAGRRVTRAATYSSDEES